MGQTHVTNPHYALVYTAASAIGLVAGMRTLTAPAVVAHVASSGCTGVPREDFGVLGRPGARNAIMILAGMEAIADKLPFMPNRTDAGALAGRLLSGALCGATICAAMGRSRVLGAIAGTVGALGATFAAHRLRTQISHELGVPDAAVALIEDATAVWTGKAICHGLAIAGGKSAIA